MGYSTSQAFMEHDGETENVGAAIDQVPGQLLRTHVLQGADTFRCLQRRLGDAEICERGPVVVIDQNVRRFDVAMNDAVVVQRPISLLESGSAAGGTFAEVPSIGLSFP